MPEFYFGAYSNSSVMLVGTAISKQQYTHVAIARIGSSVKMFVGGKTVASGTCSAAGLNLNTNITLGNYYNTSGVVGVSGITPYNGLMDLVRITKGVARYTGDFTPAIYSLDASDPYWSNVVLAMNFESGIADLIGHTVTNSGVVMCPVSPTGASSYFNGASYISAPANTRFQFGGDFCIDGWFWPTTVTSTQQYLFCWWTSGTATACSLNASIGSSGLFLGYGVGSTNTPTTAAGTINAAAWNHFAISRSGSCVTIFVNGTLVSTATVSGTLNYSANPFYIGVSNTTGSLGSYFKGFMADFRITKGASRYIDRNGSVGD